MKKDIKQLLPEILEIPWEKFSYYQVEQLPGPVKRYFRHVLKEGQRSIHRAAVTHGGLFRTGETSEWLPIEGEEYFTAWPPGFVWYGRVKLIPFVWVQARDRYIHGRGDLNIKLLSMVKVKGLSGPEIDQGTLLRWLTEAVWFPTALLPSEYLCWEYVIVKNLWKNGRDTT